MAKPQGTKRGKPKDSTRRVKKKVSILNSESVDYIDWKDANLLRRFMSDRAKIRARRVTGNDTKQQRDIAKAIKNAREMALLPYTNRVTTQRGGRRGDRDGDDRRGPRGDRPDRPDRAEREGRDDAAAAPAEFEQLDTGTDEVVETLEVVEVTEGSEQ
jgi:small subunit ribosomal protein S18